MGYFERNNKEFFMLFVSTRADLYFDIIDSFAKETRGKNELNIETAKLLVELEMKKYPNLCGEQVTSLDLINELENKKWITKHRSGIRVFYRLTANALTQYKAMVQMDDERNGNNFEFQNAIAQIYHICNDFITNKKDYDGKSGFFYTAFLKAITEIVDNIITELQKCEADFEQQSARLNDEMELYELVNTMTSILDGKAMKSYYRLLNDDNRFMKYQQTILDTLYDVKDLYIDELIKSYIVEENEWEENALEDVESELSKIIQFFDYEYSDSKQNIMNIQRKCSKKINNRLIAYEDGMSKDGDIATKFISKVVNEISTGKELYEVGSDELLNYLRFYSLSTFEGPKSFRHKIEKFASIKPEETDNFIIDPKLEKENQERLLRERNERIQHDEEHTIIYMENTYGKKDKIYSRELKLNNKDDARRVYDIIRYSLGETKNFPYELEEIDEEISNNSTYMEILTPFVLIRKEENKK